MIAVYVMPESLTKEQYNKAREALAATDANFDGRKHHSCIGEEGKLAVYEIWESQEAYDAFGKFLMPVLQETRHQAKVTGHHASSEPGAVRAGTGGASVLSLRVRDPSGQACTAIGGTLNRNTGRTFWGTGRTSDRRTCRSPGCLGSRSRRKHRTALQRASIRPYWPEELARLTPPIGATPGSPRSPLGLSGLAHPDDELTRHCSGTVG